MQNQLDTQPEMFNNRTQGFSKKSLLIFNTVNSKCKVPRKGRRVVSTYLLNRSTLPFTIL